MIKELKDNFIEVFSKPKYLVLSLIIFILLSFIFHINTHYDLMKGNYGMLYFYINNFSQFLISFLFSIFVSVTVYKYIKFSSFSAKENGASFFGTIIGVLVAGCPACSITFATYLGLAGVFVLFPWHGLELKLLSVPLLLYANYSTLKSLNYCKIKKKKK